MVKARPWTDIEHDYQKLVSQNWQIQPMVDLVKHIINSRLSDRLFAYTSLDKLIVGIYDPLEPHRETLHIKFDGNTQKWLFEYYPKPFEPVEFQREYSFDKGIEKLEGFLKLIKW